MSEGRWSSTGSGADAVALLREVGLFRLGGTDGCLCSGCEIVNYEIYFSCRKSDKTLYVRCPSMGTSMEDLQAVAIEAMRQIREQDNWSELRVRFGNYAETHQNKCVYCAKPRKDPDGYLCEKCLTGKDANGLPIADHHDFTRIDFEWPPGADGPRFKAFNAVFPKGSGPDKEREAQ